MNQTVRFILLGLVGLVLVGFLFWSSQPAEVETSYVAVQKNRVASKLKERSTYTDLPITYSADQIGKSNPFQ